MGDGACSRNVLSYAHTENPAEHLRDVGVGKIPPQGAKSHTTKGRVDKGSESQILQYFVLV